MVDGGGLRVTPADVGRVLVTEVFVGGDEWRECWREVVVRVEGSVLSTVFTKVPNFHGYSNPSNSSARVGRAWSYHLVDGLLLDTGTSRFVWGVLTPRDKQVWRDYHLGKA